MKGVEPFLFQKACWGYFLLIHEGITLDIYLVVSSVFATSFVIFFFFKLTSENLRHVDIYQVKRILSAQGDTVLTLLTLV